MSIPASLLPAIVGAVVGVDVVAVITGLVPVDDPITTSCPGAAIEPADAAVAI